MGNLPPSPITRQTDVDSENDDTTETKSETKSEREPKTETKSVTNLREGFEMLNLGNDSSINTSGSISFKDVKRNLNFSSKSDDLKVKGDVRKGDWNDENPNPSKKQKKQRKDGKKTKLSSYKKNKKSLNKKKSKKKISRKKN